MKSSRIWAFMLSFYYVSAINLIDILSHYFNFIYLFIDNSVYLLFLIFSFTLFYFAILYWFCHTLTWMHHRCTCDPKHVAPSHLPPHNIPLGHPHAPAPSMLYPARLSNFHTHSGSKYYWPQICLPFSLLSLLISLSPSLSPTCFYILHNIYFKPQCQGTDISKRQSWKGKASVKYIRVHA